MLYELPHSTSADASSYVFLGCSRQRDAIASAKAFEVEAGNRLGQGQGGLLTPSSPFSTSHSVDPMSMTIPDFNLGPSALEKSQHGYEQTIYDVGAPLSPFHYQLRKVSFLSGPGDAFVLRSPVMARAVLGGEDP